MKEKEEVSSFSYRNKNFILSVSQKYFVCIPWSDRVNIKSIYSQILLFQSRISCFHGYLTVNNRRSFQILRSMADLLVRLIAGGKIRVRAYTVTSFDVDLRNWKKDIDLRYRCLWCRNRTWMLIWVLHIYILILLCGRSVVFSGYSSFLQE